MATIAVLNTLVTADATIFNAEMVRSAKRAEATATGVVGSLRAQEWAMRMGADEAKLYQMALSGVSIETRDQARAAMASVAALEAQAAATAAATASNQAAILTGRNTMVQRAMHRTAQAAEAQQAAIGRGVAVTHLVQTAHERYIGRADELRGMLLRGTITQETYGRAMRLAATEAGGATGALARLGPMVAVTAGLMGVRLAGSAIRGAVDIARFADETKGAARQLGITTEALTRMQFAAELNGSSAEAVTKAIGQMNKNLGAAGTSGNKASEAINSLGLDFFALRKMSPDQQFLEIADRLAGVESPAERARVAFALFGRGGLDVINVLSLGKQGLIEFGQESDRVGNTLKTLSANVLGETSDAVKEMGFAWDGATRSMAEFAGPSITKFSNGITDLLGGLRAATKEGALWSGEMKSGLEDILRGVAGMKLMDVPGRANPTKATPVDPALIEAAERLAEAQADLEGDTRSATQALVRQIKTMGMSAAEMTAYDLAARGAAAGHTVLIEKLGQRLEALQLEKDIRTVTEALVEQTMTFGMSATAIEAYRLKKRGASAADVAMVEALGREVAALEEQKKAMEDAAQAQQKAIDDATGKASQMFDNTRTPLERYRQQLEEIESLHRFLFIDDDVRQRAMDLAKAELDQTMKVEATDVGNAQAFDVSSRLDVGALSGFQPDDEAERANGAKLDQIGRTLTRIESKGGGLA